MALKIKIGKAEHDALDESLKTLYVPDGDNFKLDADYEDVDGLKAKRDELLAKVAEANKALKAFEGLDPAKAREAVEKLNKSEDEDLLNKRKFDELIQKKNSEWEVKEKGYQEKISGMVRTQAEQQLAMKLTEQGVKPAMAEDLALTLTAKHIQFVEDGGGVVWKTKDGLETVDLDKYIPSLKESKADYFKPVGGAGSGASGSNGNGGNAKTWTRAQWNAASNDERSAFSTGGGQVTD